MSSTTIGVVIYTLLILALGIYIGIIMTRRYEENLNVDWTPPSKFNYQNVRYLVLVALLKGIDIEKQKAIGRPPTHADLHHEAQEIIEKVTDPFKATNDEE
jgi:hypothetical protein